MSLSKSSSLFRRFVSLLLQCGQRHLVFTTRCQPPLKVGLETEESNLPSITSMETLLSPFSLSLSESPMMANGCCCSSSLSSARSNISLSSRSTALYLPKSSPGWLLICANATYSPQCLQRLSSTKGSFFSSSLALFMV